MWQGVGACGRGSGLVDGQKHATGVGKCGRVWRHVVGCGDMYHGVWICHRGSGLVHGRRHVPG